MSEVHDTYLDLLQKGRTAKDAAKEAQNLTGMSLVTGRPIRQKGPVHKTQRKWLYGEYDA